MSKGRFQEEVESLLRACRLTKAPIEVRKVAAHLDIDVRLAPTKEDVSGALIVDGDRAYIAVNDTHHINRQRFTIAHEIGHFRLHDTGDRIHFDEDFRVYSRDGRSSLAIDSKEIEANQFAAELLMPTHLLRQDFIRVRGTEDDVVRDLAGKYKVSAKAMEFRLQNLGLILPAID